MKIRNLFTLMALASLSSSSFAQSGASDHDLRQANNPLASVKAFNIHNYYVPSLYDGGDMKANTMMFRYAQPIGKVLLRGTLPIATSISADGVSQSGLGDFNLFGIYLLGKSDSPNQFGIGPYVVAPTATSASLGGGKWQLGAAAIAFFAKNPIFQSGMLLTWQKAIAGDSDRADINTFALQPFGMWQLGGGTYLRSTGTATYDVASGHYNVPLGLGIGRVLKVNETVFNIFIEPQYSVLHYGSLQPQMQIFVGFNMQFR